MTRNKSVKPAFISGMMPDMRSVTRFAAVLLACGALSACSEGGEGEGCASGGGWLAPLHCNEGLICNGAAGNICERPMNRPENGPCDADALCATGLWCDTTQQKCRPWLGEGAPCSNPFSCGPILGCVHDLATLTTICGPRPPEPDGGVTQATTVAGTLTLPGTAQAKGTVAVFATLPPAGTAVASSGIMSTGSTTFDYRILDVPAGTYFILGFFDVDSSGGTSSTPGDYTGWYGHNGDGNPPPAPNAVVPAAGTVRFDFSLVLR